MARIVLCIGMVFMVVSMFGQGATSPLSPEQLKENNDVRRRIFKDDFRDYVEDVAVDSQFSYQTRVFIPYNPIREADVMWGKRVWRRIPVKERINYPLFYPHERDDREGAYIHDRESLFKILVDATKSGDLISFSPFHPTAKNKNDPTKEVEDDEFEFPMTISEFEERTKFFFTKNIEDAEGNLLPDTTYIDVFSSNIVSYEIKEDWYFDKQRSQLMVKILGICPIFTYLDPNTNQQSGEIRMAWFYFPHVRYILSNKEAYNIQNEYVRITFDDIFMKRRFSSFITKEGNVYDRNIKSIAALNSMDKLFESERIKNEMFEFEHDLWDY